MNESKIQTTRTKTTREKKNRKPSHKLVRDLKNNLILLSLLSSGFIQQRLKCGLHVLVAVFKAIVLLLALIFSLFAGQKTVFFKKTNNRSIRCRSIQTPILATLYQHLFCAFVLCTVWNKWTTIVCLVNIIDGISCIWNGLTVSFGRQFYKLLVFFL